MKPRLCLLLFALLVPSLHAQEPAEDPRAGALVDCGSEKVAIFEHSESRDGRYALGWTLRPNHKKEPFDWSTYHRDQTMDTILSATADDDADKGDYVLVNGMLDLKDKVFTLLPSKDPYFPNYNRHGLSAAWSEARDGARDALVAYGSRFATDELFLVHLGPGPARIVNLSPEADKAVAARMRKRDPKDYRGYETSYAPRDEADSGTPRTEFRPGSVKVHFETSVPKSAEDIDAGSITFALPRGNVVRLDFDKKKR